MTTADEKMREEFEQWYVENAFDYPGNPIGSRDCGLQRKAWQASAAQYSERIKELERDVEEYKASTMFYSQQNEQLQAQVAMLVDALNPFCDGDIPDTDAPENYCANAKHAINATTQTAEAYKRRVQAEALEAAAQFFIEEPNSASRRAAKELDRMAAELKEGE